MFEFFRPRVSSYRCLKHVSRHCLFGPSIWQTSAAIEELRETLVKEPSSAPYAQNLLGVEYIEDGHFAEARSSFEEAVRLMPHESVNHSNLGYSLAAAGDLKSAEQEARTAIQLDAANSRAKTLLELILHARRTKKR